MTYKKHLQLTLKGYLLVSLITINLLRVVYFIIIN